MAPSRVDGVVYIHESGDIELEISDIPRYLFEETGKAIKQVELDDWIRKAKEMGLSSEISAVFMSLGKEDTMKFPRLLRGS